MCHLLLFMPFLMLPVFWLWPASVAVPFYTLAAIASGVLYWYWLKSARMPKLNGAEGMLGARGRVDRGERQVKFFFHGELWSAEADGDALAVGDEAVVVGIEGLRLRVRKATA
jgi:membrane protein implicated in regulation of membrane protease activity